MTSLGPHSRMSEQRSATIAYTAMALLAFAANSVLCRMALRDGAIDAASFSTLRVGSRGAGAPCQQGAAAAVSSLGVMDVGGSAGALRAAVCVCLHAVEHG